MQHQQFVDGMLIDTVSSPMAPNFIIAADTNQTGRNTALMTSAFGVQPQTSQSAHSDIRQEFEIDEEAD